MAASLRRSLLIAFVTLCAAGLAPATHAAPASAAGGGLIQVTFLYMPPGQIEPTYHTAIWLEDAKGGFVQTLYVTQELSATEYKMGQACPDWIKQAHWERAPKATVDAVTGPTPNVGAGALEFDTAKLNIGPGTYRFKFQVHIGEKYNVLHQATVVVGGAAASPAVEVLYSPSKPAGEPDLVRDLQVHYVPR